MPAVRPGMTYSPSTGKTQAPGTKNKIPAGNKKLTNCVIPMPTFGPLGGGGCLFSKTQARALAGGLFLFVSGSMAFVGVAVLAAAGFQKSGGVEAAAKIAEVVPGGGAVATGIRAAGRGDAAGTAAAGISHARARREEREKKEASARRDAQARAQSRKRQEDKRRREAERLQREKQRTEPARGKHAKESEKGPYEGKHRGG